ncbi:MAG: hypothetical protein QS748_06135 [Candidatus Endonucleobacter bathymodioli]|uniref:Uncharacterized protein n=1 Tax=Candidatus Endonucleibacter bathymodioli TaxID=539814 RepID=A0AA90NV28_9GAMM|nr:hypothetical protein [Candidatus Endonucleobacter bathymodioli]
MKIRKAIKLALIGVISLISTTVMAATQGAVGTDSTGSVDLRFSQGAIVRIWGLIDVSLGPGKLIDGYDFCTYNNTTGSYTVTPTSINKFKLVNTTSVVGAAVVGVDYTMRLSDNGLAGNTLLWGFGGLPSGQHGTVQFESQQDIVTSDICEVESHQTTSMEVAIPTLPVGVMIGSYADTVVLVIAPK